jgi:hypothetical protein
VKYLTLGSIVQSRQNPKINGYITEISDRIHVVLFTDPYETYRYDTDMFEVYFKVI